MVYTRFTRSAMQRLQLAVVAVLVLAAEDEVNVGRKRFQRLDRRVHVGGLGVVVVLHAAQRGDVLQAMLHGAEILDRAANRRRLHSGGHADGDGGQHVFHVVRALQRNLGERHDLHRFLVSIYSVAIHNRAVLHKRAALHLMLAAEPQHLRLQSLGEPAAWLRDRR